MNKEEKLAKLDQVIEEYKKETEKECYAIKIVDGEPDITDNKLGGQPYLPVGEEYPKDENGVQLALLFQVNLKDVDLPDWPNEGVLEIFTDPAVEWPCRYAVKYFPADQEYQKDLPEIDTSEYIFPSGHKITLEKAVTYMSPNDFRFNDVITKIMSDVYGEKFENHGDIMDFFEGDDTWSDKLYRLNSETPGIALGGYQDFTQYDPRGTKKGSPEKTESLLKFDSVCEDGKYMIGDSGILFTFISPEDLREKKFENAVVDWDCC